MAGLLSFIKKKIEDDEDIYKEVKFMQLFII